MSRRSSRIVALLLALLMLLTGCVGAKQGTKDVTAEIEKAKSEERVLVDWAKDAVIYEVNVRQYTPEGTFAAFSEHLDTLKDMGINTIWFMPIHPISLTNRSGGASALGSYYSITDYREVNPEFGTKEDFAALVEKAHSMGFKVMLDWVANHTGWDCPWIKDHPDWYTQDENGKIISPLNMGWPDVADLNYDNAEMRAEMIECMKYWVEEFDIDGYRCDYATGVPIDFWENARYELEQIKPLLMLAEDNKVKSLLTYAFDMNYNWNLYDTLLAVANGSKTADRIKFYIPSDYPDGTYALNFLDNHDKNSYEHTIADYGAEVLPSYFALMYTIPGTPLIYSGDEIGLDHRIEFMVKDTINWDSGTADYRPLLTALAKIREENPALYAGNVGGAIEYIDTGSKNVLAFSRENDGDKIICVLNLAKREKEVDLSGVLDGSETVLLSGLGAEVSYEQSTVSEAGIGGAVTMQPWKFYIIKK